MSRQALFEEQKIFHSESGEELSLRSVVLRIREKIASDPEASYEVVVGSDSHAKLEGTAAFVTAIVVRRVGNGAIYFWTRSEERFGGLQDRIWKEALLSITLAQELRSMMRNLIGDEVFWERKLEVACIHIDMGEGGPTRTLISSISGMVRGFDFEPVIKPFAYAASVVADRHT